MGILDNIFWKKAVHPHLIVAEQVSWALFASTFTDSYLSQLREATNACPSQSNSQRQLKRLG
jgi:hypothetical protein